MTLNALPKTDKTLGTHYAKLLPPWPFPDSLTPMDFPLGFSTTQFLLSFSLSLSVSLNPIITLSLVPRLRPALSRPLLLGPTSSPALSVST